MRHAAILCLAVTCSHAVASPPVVAPPRQDLAHPTPGTPRGTPRGLPDCPDPIGDQACHRADPSLPAPYSNAVPNDYRVMENFRPLQRRPERICWLGRYEFRQLPAVADETFSMRIFEDLGGFPDLAAGPVFERTFRQSGTPGQDALELDCLDGDSCPGIPNPPSGGNFVYSVRVNGGIPLEPGRCYWIEIANIASAEAGLRWTWCTSTEGTDNLALQAVEGAYTPYAHRARDLALCVSGGLDITTPGCTLPLPPPICTNDPANGHPYDGQTTVGLRASSMGSVGRPDLPNAWTPFERAEDFHVQTTTEVTGLCFWGFWVGITDDGDPVPVVPPPDPAFDVTYYVNASGVPGLPLPMATFRVGATPGVTMVWDGEDAAAVAHPPITFHPDTCYWVSVGLVQSQQQLGEPVTPLWHWRLTTAAIGNQHVASRQVDLPDPAWTSFTCKINCDFVNLAFTLSAGPAVAATCVPDTFQDCDLNGLFDPHEIAADPTLDCFNPSAPGLIGGPDGALDACQCPADWDRGGTVNSADISAFLTAWLAAVSAHTDGADLDCSGGTSSADISAFLSVWLEAATMPGGTHGCP